jgi:hypothetical protein
MQNSIARPGSAERTVFSVYFSWQHASESIIIGSLVEWWISLTYEMLGIYSTLCKQQILRKCCSIY